MAEYIEREALIDKTSDIFKNGNRYRVIFFDDVILAPAADVAPVVHGHWIICSDGYYPYCSRCKEEPTSRKMTKFCDHCGVKMDEEANHDD